MTSLVPTDREQSAVPQSPRSQRLKLLRVLIPVALLLVAIALGWRYWFTRTVDSGLHLSGRIEGYETDLGQRWAVGLPR